MADKIVEVPGVGNVAFPDTMSDDEISAKIRGSQTPQPKSVGGFLSNLGSSAGNFASDVAGAVIHPGQTVAGVTGLLEGMAEKSGFSPVGGVSHAQNVDALIDLYKQKYGNGLLEALYKDPVGVAADVATLASGVGAAGKGVQLAADAANLGRVANVAGTVARAGDVVSSLTDPLRVAGRVADVTGVSGLVGRGVDAASEALTKGALRGGFNVNTDAAEVAGAVKAMNEAGIPFSEEGLQKVQQAIKDIQQQKLAVTGGSPLRVDPAAVELRLDEVAGRRDWQVNPNADVSQIEKLRQNFRERTGGQPIVNAKGKVVGYRQGPPIPVDEAEALKEGTYAQNKYGTQAPPQLQATAEGEKALARGLKEELERQIPELTSLNAEQARYLNLDKILEAAVNKHINSGGFWGNVAQQTFATQKGALKTAAILGSGVATHEPSIAATVALAHAVLSDPVVKQGLARAINKAQQLNPGKYGAPSVATALSRVDDYVNSLQSNAAR